MKEKESMLFQQILKEADPEQLSSYFAAYSSETISLILYHLSPSRAAEILAYFPSSKQLEIIQYLVHFETIPKPMQQQIMTKTSALLGKKFEEADILKGSKQFAKEMIGCLDQSQQHYLMDELKSTL